MLDAFKAATQALPRERVHLEYFAGGDVAAGGGFTVRLKRSGRTIPVAAGQTILDALLACGIEALHSCRSGVCGTCEVGVVSGIPDHRDFVQSDAQKAANTHILICCSGSKTPELELDL
jgi:vanillate O-demethylase ferredoxin subunit